MVVILVSNKLLKLLLLLVMRSCSVDRSDYRSLTGLLGISTVSNLATAELAALDK